MEKETGVLKFNSNHLHVSYMYNVNFGFKKSFYKGPSTNIVWF